MFATLVAAAFIGRGQVGQGQVNHPGQALVGFAVMFLLAVEVAAVVLGIAALCQRGRKHLFGILGLAISSVTIVSPIGFLIIGLYGLAELRK